MPPGSICAKCRQLAASPGDTWCSGCSGWEYLGRELSGSWDSSGARLLAGDLVVNTARQVRALRSLCSGLVRREQGVAGESRASPRRRTERSPEPRDTRESLPRRRSEKSARQTPKKEDTEEEEAQESEEEEEERRRPAKSPEHRPVKDPHHRPPEPEGPPPSPRTSGTHREEKRSSGRTRESKPHHHSGHRTSDRKRRRPASQRGGRKHQRLQRLASNPLLEVHRKPPPEFWELSSGRERPFELGNLGK